MSTPRLNPHPTILLSVLADRLWGERDFFLIDVGASGGLEKHWQLFGDRLRAIAFEPLVHEAERLQRMAAGTGVRYEAAFVTCRNYDACFPVHLRNDRTASRNNDPFQRVSAMKAQALLQMNYVEQVFNAGAPQLYADRHVVLDDVITVDDQPAVDFIKIDTDGHDFPVLLGTEELLQRGGALGFSIEAQFHGASHDYANTFSNIDRFMRSHGFSLFDLEPYRYSRAALPAPFAHDIPAQTLSGQVMWGEAVYFRDLADPDYERMWSYEVTPERVLKLACLFDLFSLPDCAAELLVTRDVNGSGALLDALAKAVSGAESYEDAIRRFADDPRHLYPGRMKREPENEAAVARPASAEPSPQVKALQRKVERLEKKIGELQERVRRRDERLRKSNK
jgi:FkbM family methyltransferase